MTEEQTEKGEQAEAAGAEANGRARADGLSRRQLRALEALAAAGGPLYRKELARRAGIDPTRLSNAIGYLDDAVNSREVHAVNLLNRKFVRYVTVKGGGKERVAVEATAAGRRVLEAAKEAGAAKDGAK